jgi:hypothetical protein
VIGAEQPITLKNFRCGLLQLEDIEQAERFCRRWNNFSFNEQKKLKAHIHPMSHLIRKEESKSDHFLFHY